MDKSTKSLTINELIKGLQDMKAEYGNVEVVISGDPEGNNFGTLSQQYSYGYEEDSKILVLYPVEQFTDF